MKPQTKLLGLGYLTAIVLSLVGLTLVLTSWHAAYIEAPPADNLVLAPGDTKDWGIPQQNVDITIVGNGVEWSEGFTLPSDVGDRFAKRDKSKVLRIELLSATGDKRVGEMVFDAEPGAPNGRR